MNKEIKLKFRVHRRSDIPYRVKWLNDPKINKYIGDNPGEGTTKKKQEKWFDNYQKNRRMRFFTILDQKKPIGIVGLSKIDKNHKNANLFVMIGDDGYRGVGLCSDILGFIINFGFEELKLHKINLGVFEEHKEAIGCYKKAGFKIEGVLEDEVFFNKKFHNFILMGIININ